MRVQHRTTFWRAFTSANPAAIMRRDPSTRRIDLFSVWDNNRIVYRWANINGEIPTKQGPTAQ